MRLLRILFAVAFAVLILPYSSLGSPAENIRVAGVLAEFADRTPAEDNLDLGLKQNLSQWPQMSLPQPRERGGLTDFPFRTDDWPGKTVERK